ncbi:hypothetical protein T11_15204, partial [Trichinella zimbabwensis]
LFLTLLSCNGMELNTTSEELIASPIYELELQLHEGITRKIEIESGQAFTLRCIDSTGTSFHSENLLWLHQGKRLRDSTINKIKIKNTKKFSVLIVDFFDDSMSGLYECVLRRNDKPFNTSIFSMKNFVLRKSKTFAQMAAHMSSTVRWKNVRISRESYYFKSAKSSTGTFKPASYTNNSDLFCYGNFFCVGMLLKSEKLSAQRNDRQTKSLESLLESVGENKKCDWPEYSISDEALRILITEKQDKSERSPSKCANDENHSSFQDHINEQNCFINRSLNKNFDTLKNPKNKEYTSFNTIYYEISIKLIFFSCILLNFVLFFLSRLGHVVINDSTRKQAISFSGISPLRTTISTAYTN